MILGNVPFFRTVNSSQIKQCYVENNVLNSQQVSAAVTARL